MLHTWNIRKVCPHFSLSNIKCILYSKEEGSLSSREYDTLVHAFNIRPLAYSHITLKNKSAYIFVILKHNAIVHTKFVGMLFIHHQTCYSFYSYNFYQLLSLAKYSFTKKIYISETYHHIFFLQSLLLSFHAFEQLICHKRDKKEQSWRWISPLYDI
jgi:hypothetical protein